MCRRHRNREGIDEKERSSGKRVWESTSCNFTISRSDQSIYSFIRYAEHDYCYYCYVLCQYAYQLTGLLENVTRYSTSRPTSEG